MVFIAVVVVVVVVTWLPADGWITLSLTPVAFVDIVFGKQVLGILKCLFVFQWLFGCGFFVGFCASGGF